ncbi:MAG TPA: hypothetical protein VGB50_06875 [Flavobacterium sp.]|jgi:hypothetical protein
MKTIHYFTAVVLLMVSFTSQAQTQLTEASIAGIVNDDELPVVGVRYYYYPNLDAYFDTQSNLYIYRQNGSWVKAKEIAAGYRGYSILNNVRVAITDYDGDTPFTKLKEHQAQFPKKYKAKRVPPKPHSDDKVAYN